MLDSLHTEEHVLKELEIYSKIVSKKSYLIVQDTFVEFFPKNHFKNRPWDKGNNPLTAVKKFLKITRILLLIKKFHQKLGSQKIQWDI